MSIILPKHPKIFISSTIFDLQDIRGGIKKNFEDYGVTVYASETEDFPILNNKHSYDICLTRLKECDLVICIIDIRFGGLYEYENGTPVSITRKEIREAEQANIPIWTFVRNETWKERHQFKEFIISKKASAPTDELFNEFKNSIGSKIQNQHVFSLIDEITRFKKNNWIFKPFENSYDLLGAIQRQFEFFLHQFYNNTNFSSPQAEAEISNTFQQFIESSVTFRENNLKALSIHLSLLNSSQHFKNKAIIELNKISAKTWDSFIKGYLTSSTQKAIDKGAMFITDTTMETMNPSVWRNSHYHRMIIESTKRIVKKYSFNINSYSRVLILFNPIAAISDSEWIKSFEFLISFHRMNNLGLGVCLRRALPYELDSNAINYYLVPDELAAIWDPTTGMAFELTKKYNRSWVSYFTDHFLLVKEICDKGESGYWIEKNMTATEAIEVLKSILGTTK